MIIGKILDRGSSIECALQICTDSAMSDNGFRYCENARKVQPNPTPTRLGFCSWCWGATPVVEAN